MKAGDQLGVYRIVEKVGDGGMGEVFRAVDDTLGRSVALKCLRPEVVGNAQLVERFRSEARLLARLEHPNIATVYTLLDEGGMIALVMEYVGGGSLEGLLRRKGRLDKSEVIPLVLQALDGIGYAHASGVIHRDLKPSNAMLSESGLVKLVDFGIARAIGSARMTRTGHLVGTLEYMAPEQVKGGEGDARSDIYSVGIMLFELLTGNPPFKGATDYDLIRAHVENPVPPLRDFGATADEALEGVLLRALAKEPADRYPDAAAFSEALRFAAPEAATARPLAATAVAPTAGGLGGGGKLLDRIKAPFQGGNADRGLRIVMGALVALLLAEGLYLGFGGRGSTAEMAPTEEARQIDEADEKPSRTRVSRSISEEPIRESSRQPIPVPPKNVPSAPEKVEKAPAPKKKTQVATRAPASLGAKIDSINVHGSMRRSGAFSRAAGYSVKATLTGGQAKVDEVYEVYSGGSRVLRTVVVSRVRKPGRFSSRARVGALKKLDPGTYDARLRLESGGKLLAQHKFRLRIR